MMDVVKIRFSRKVLDELFDREGMYDGDYMDHEELNANLEPYKFSAELLNDGVRIGVLASVGDMTDELATFEFNVHDDMVDKCGSFTNVAGEVLPEYAPNVAFLPGGDLDFNISSDKMSDGTESIDDVKKEEEKSDDVVVDRRAPGFSMYSDLLAMAKLSGIVITDNIDVAQGRADAGLPTVYVPSKETCDGSDISKFKILLDTYRHNIETLSNAKINHIIYVLGLTGFKLMVTAADVSSNEDGVVLCLDDFAELIASCMALNVMYERGVSTEDIGDLIMDMGEIDDVCEEVSDVLIHISSMESVDLIKEVALSGALFMGDGYDISNDTYYTEPERKDDDDEVNKNEEELEEDEIIINPNKVISDGDEMGIVEDKEDGILINLAVENNGEQKGKQEINNNMTIEEIVNMSLEQNKKNNDTHVTELGGSESENGVSGVIDLNLSEIESQLV